MKYSELNSYHELPLTLHRTCVIRAKVSSNPADVKTYSMQQYVIKFVNGLEQVGGFLWLLRFPIPVKLTEILLKVAINTITLRDRPFNLKGGVMVFCFVQKFFFRTTQELEY